MDTSIQELFDAKHELDGKTKKIDIAIKALQDICNHEETKYISVHYDIYTCQLCGRKRSV